MAATPTLLYTTKQFSKPVKGEVDGVVVDGSLHVAVGLEGVVRQQVEEVPGVRGQTPQLLQLLHAAGAAGEEVQRDGLPPLDGDGVGDERHDAAQEAVQVTNER